MNVGLSLWRPRQGKGDVIAPTLTSVAISNAAPTVVVLTYDENFSGTLPLASVWTVSGSTVSSRAAGASPNIINLTLSAPVGYSATKTVSYTKSGTNDLQDAAGNKSANLVNQAITNNVLSRVDAFTRADSAAALGSPTDGGTAWTEAGGSTWGISTNRAYVPTYATDAFAVLTSGVANATVQVTIAAVDGVAATNTPGIIFRYQDASNFMLLHCDFAGTMAIYKRTAGAYGAALASAAVTFSVSDVLKVTVDSSGNIAGFQNGVSKVTVTDNSYSTQTTHGLRSAQATVSLMFDDFSIA